MRPAILTKRHSAGGVIYRLRDGIMEIALISVKKGRLWTLPKGLVDEGETVAQAARREVREESGLNGDIICPLGSVTYWYYVKSDNVKCRKRVDYFLMIYTSGSTADHDHEVETAQWFEAQDAIETVRYRSDVEMLTKAVDLVSAELVKDKLAKDESAQSETEGSVDGS